MEKCQFCGREAKNIRSNQQHELRCKDNPNRILVKPSYGMLGKKGHNKFTKAKELGLPSPVVSKESIEKGLETKKKNGSLNHTNESRKRISDSMRIAVEKYPESYSSSNRGRVKQIIFDDIKFRGNGNQIFIYGAEKITLRLLKMKNGLNMNGMAKESITQIFIYQNTIGLLKLKVIKLKEMMQNGHSFH